MCWVYLVICILTVLAATVNYAYTRLCFTIWYPEIHLLTKMSSLLSPFTKFKDAILKGAGDLPHFGTSLGDYGVALSSKLKKASSVFTKANTLNDVENERLNRKLK